MYIHLLKIFDYPVDYQRLLEERQSLSPEYRLIYNLFRGILSTSDLELLEHSVFIHAGVLLDDYLEENPFYSIQGASYRDLLNIAMEAVADDRDNLNGLLTLNNWAYYASNN